MVALFELGARGAADAVRNGEQTAEAQLALRGGVSAASGSARCTGCRSRSRTTSIRPIFRMRWREAISKPGKTLGHRGFASTYGLPHLETLELRMVDVERLILAGILVDGTKCLRLGPRFEGTLVLPDRM